MNFKTGFLAICLAAAAGAFGMGCSSPCDDLADICSTCADGIVKAGCDSVVNADDSDLCDAGIEGYDALCN